MGRGGAPERAVRRSAFARDFGAAVRASGLTLGEISRRLADADVSLSVATLSYWQRGRSMPTRGTSIRTLTLLEQILGLPGGTLLRHTAGEPGWFPDDAHGSGRLDEMVAELGLARNRLFQLVAVADELVLGPDCTRATQKVRQYMRVTVGQAERVTLALAEEGGPAPEVVALAGGSISRELHDDREGLTVAGFELPRTMAHGELFWIEYEVRWPRVDEERDIATRVLAGLCSVLSLDVVFTGEPPAVAEYTCQPFEDVPVQRWEVPVVGNRVQVVLADAVAGEHAVTWHR